MIMKSKQKKKMNRDWILLGITLIIVIVLLTFFPDRTEPVISTAQEYFIEMMIILPAIMVIMGIFSVYISDETVVKHYSKGWLSEQVALNKLLSAQQ